MASHFSAEFIEKQRLWLVNRRISLRESAHNLQQGSSGDFGDKASDEAMAACQSSLAEKRFGELANIDAALTRIQHGNYGFCEVTGEPISVERLEAFPTTRFSIKAQSKLESRHRWRPRT